jgi:protein gp37
MGKGLVTCHEDLLDIPRKKLSPTVFFVNNMGDPYHPDVPRDFVKRMFHTMNECTRHKFFILTKRTGRLLATAPDLMYSSNIWLGVTVESAKYATRIDDVRKIDAQHRWLMFEPLIGPIGKVDLTGIEYAMCGGESGIGFRPMDIEWAREIRDQCATQRVRFNFMQYAAVDPRPLGRMLDGRMWTDLPLDSLQYEMF